jgi:hypothetical protein
MNPKKQIITIHEDGTETIEIVDYVKENYMKPFDSFEFNIWSRKIVQEKFKSDFKAGFPRVHSNINGEFLKSYGELENGKIIELYSPQWQEKL